MSTTNNVKILLRRGLRKDVSADTLETGELGFTNDTNQLFVGIDDAVNEIQFDPFANAQAVIQSWLNSADNPEPGLTVDEDLVIRNVTDINTSLKEAFRVLKPGGRFMCLEFSKINNEFLNYIYAQYSKTIPLVGKYIVGTNEPYEYLVKSILKKNKQRRKKVNVY